MPNLRFNTVLAVVLLSLGAVFGAPVSRAETFVLPPPGVNVIGAIQTVYARHEDTLSDIARRYNVGYDEITLANPDVDPWLPGEGTAIIVPSQYILPDAPREGLVLNVPEMRVYYYPPVQKGKPPLVVTFPASIGRMEWQTPLGKTKIVKKQAYPTWYPTDSIRAEHLEDGDPLPKSIPPGPENPLGTHALRLGIPGYLIHGTNKPYGIGMRVTHGCIRLYPEDIRALFDMVPVDAPVYVVNQPFKAGWRNGLLYVEAHPPLEEDRGAFESNRTPAVKAVVAASPDTNSAIDWNTVAQITEGLNGVPGVVSTSTLDVASVLSETQSRIRQTLDGAVGVTVTD